MDRARVQATVGDLLSRLRGSQLSKSQALMAINELKQQFSDFDYDYVCALLFPETHAPSRLPSKFSLPTALFTQRFTTYVSTGAFGNGFISFLPQDTSYRCLYKSSATVDFANITNGFLTECSSIPESDSTYIPANYSQVRLLGASMRMQYIGVAQEESGIVNASHVYETEIGRISDEIIDNGYFNVRGRPYEGCRMTWLPKDNSDFELYDSNVKVVDIDNTNTENAFSPLTDITRPDISGSALKVAYHTGVDGWVNSVGDISNNVGSVWGIGAKKKQQTHPTQLIISFRGMPANKLWWRIDVERHFEGTPRTAIRDIVSVAKSSANERSLDAIKNVSACSYLFGHKMSEAKKVEMHFKNKMGDILQSLADGSGKYLDYDYETSDQPYIGAKPYTDQFPQGLPYINPAAINSNSDMF